MAQHGWCVPDMPNNLYSKVDAERAWGKLLALYKAGLARLHASGSRSRPTFRLAFGGIR